MPHLLATSLLLLSTATTPVTVPATSDWQSGGASYRLGSSSRIVVASDALAPTARTLAKDLRALTGAAPRVVRSDHSRAGDIVLALKRGGSAQSYQLTAAKTLRITSATDDGVFLGTRTALQLLHQSRTVPGGTATDSPVATERALMIDVAREFYTMGWLQDRIREMAYLKLNTLHLHLTDDQNFRIESSKHPELVSEQHYTKAQLRSLIAFAAEYHIEVIPEIDLPGHMSRMTAAYPELRLIAADGTVEKGALDLSKPLVRRLTRDLLDEYLPLFPGKDFHLGVDEWVPESRINNFPHLDAYAVQKLGPGARARDVLYDFVNWANRIVRASGKTMRIWNDQLFTGYKVAVDRRIGVDHWTDKPGFSTPQQLADAGHRLINSNWQKLYYSPLYIHSDPAAIYEQFRLDTFMGEKTLTTPATAAQYSIWGEVPAGLENENQIAWGTHRSLRSFAQAAWGSPKPAATFDEFLPAIDTVGQAPGYTGVDQPWDGIPTASTTMSVDPAHPVGNVVDGRPGSYLRSTAPPAGSTVTLDLGTAGPLGAISLRTATSALGCAVLDYSPDGSEWTALGDVTGHSLVQMLVPGSPTARYVRLRTTCAQTGELTIAEFHVQAVGSSAGALTTSLPTYDMFALGNAADGDPATHFWSARGVEPDDYVALDLGSVQPVHTVDLLMGTPTAPTDYLYEYLLEVSPNGVDWQQLAQYDRQAEVHLTAPAGTTARYVRFRATAAQGSWVTIRELTVR